MQGQVLTLRLCRNVAVLLYNEVNGVLADTCTKLHQTVIYILHVSVVWDGELTLHDYLTSIDVMIEEERRNAGHRLAVDDSPVYRGSTAILRQKGGMHIEGAEAGHCPHHLRQHSESHHYLQVGIIATQLLKESLILHLHRLENGQPVLQGIFLHSRCTQHRTVTSYGLIRLSDHSHNIISVFHKSLQ